MTNTLSLIGSIGASVAVAAPCDIYLIDGTPCVAAHSLVRALYDSYSGPLYSVQRVSDAATAEVGVVTPGGCADSAKVDNFCAGSRCTVHRIFDQSPQGNHLDVAPGGQHNPRPDRPVDAAKAPITLRGHRVYGAKFEGGMGYRNDRTVGVPSGDEPETIYMVTDGKHYNNQCCFDYGNAETDAHDDGRGTMEAIYWGNYQGPEGYMGAGNGPWVAADLEDGLWAGNQYHNPGNPSLNFEFVTAMVKGGSGYWGIKGGNAQEGQLHTFYEGYRPGGYETMRKQGAIVLGVGGDNSNTAVGTFYEGVMTSGYSSDAADQEVQANIVAASYGRSSPPPSPTPSGTSLLHEGRACQQQTANLGTSFDTPELCSEAAEANPLCHGYFMHSTDYWSEWGCRCCRDDEPGEYNREWNMYSYVSMRPMETGNVGLSANATSSSTTTRKPYVHYLV